MFLCTHLHCCRCVAVSWPLKYSYRISPGVACFMLSFVWVFSLMFASFPAFGLGRYAYLHSALNCALDWHQDVGYLVTRYLLCFLVPGIVIAVMFLLILKAARAQRRVFSLMPLPIGLALSASPSSVNYRRSTLQAMRTLFIIVALLTILWTPFTVVKILDLRHEGSVPTNWIRACAWISMLSSTVNPLVFLTNKKYNARFKALICSSCALDGDLQGAGEDNRVWPQDLAIATPRTLSTAVPSIFDMPSTSGFFTPSASRRSSRVSFVGANLNSLQIGPLKSSTVPVIKFNPPIVTITPSTPVHEGKGKKSANTRPKTVDAMTGLNVKTNIPTTPVHAMKSARRGSPTDVEQLYDIGVYYTE